MTAYIVQRVTESLIVLFVMSFVIYGLMGLMPGDPIDLMIQADPDLTTEDQQRLKEFYGLDQPLTERYWNWLTAALSGDFGYSRLYGQPVLEVLWPRLINTLVLLGASFALAVAIALPAGIAAASRPQSWLDNAVNLGAFAGISVPPFWLAILLILLFAVALGWLPAGGMGQDGGLWVQLQHLALPVLALTLSRVGGIVRYVRGAMMEALRENHIRTARAKGLSRTRVLFGHALRNAMIPVVTILALDMGMLVSGALITETVFGWLGMGKTIYDAVMGNDYNLALMGLLFATALTLAANLLADLTYAWLDPRISYG
ncbi:peptide/nickel transport system permease protein [Limimonas halophila]|uniref:Peptide/nickel transport system permease protein n=1 Tax=Limimonas halophila TaxID=1082479 RepID=A0A1G7T2F0_9PROT|nr:ABC transporter permease [Limimonas halophila]SDG28760.1 peptide/nickel transport system permease protein [Limimonas halophila]